MGRAQHTPPAAPASERLLALPRPIDAEDRLMLAVLLDAVAVLREQASGVCPHDRDSVEATVHWFLVKDDAWPLSFATVCKALGLDVVEFIAALRIELTELGAPGLLRPPRPRVVPLTLVHSVPNEKPARSIRHR